MLEIVEELHGLGEELKDNKVVALLLYSLLESCGLLISAHESRSEADLNVKKRTTSR